MKDDMIRHIRENKHDFDSISDLKPLMERFNDCKVVMIGEASHGTHEYYNWRARISRQLMEEHRFDFVAVEGDWPPCYLVNRYVKGYPEAGGNARDVLENFERWPSWMWANWEVHEWIEWMRMHNEKRPADQRKGFYGLDVYSLWESLDAIMDYLEKEDPSALQTARKAMRCFEPYRDTDGQRYAYSTNLVPEGCSREVTDMLTEIRNRAPMYNHDREHVFSTEQNAITAANAEKYYRIMMQGGASTWNLRDRHMIETLERLLEFHGPEAKGIVWAHNTHVGDASYTDMAEDGLFNIGEVAREQYGREQVGLIGFGSYEGSVLAGDSWGAPVEEMPLPKARPGSWEDICHRAGRQFYLFSEDLKGQRDLQREIPHRAVGVVYHPKREKYGNYVPSDIPNRYDAFLFISRTRALHQIPVHMDKHEVPETYPFGV